MAQVYVAIGSNVDPERHMALAAQSLRREFPDTRFSSWYRNRAVGFEGDDFINCVAGFTSGLTVHEVVARLQAIEALCGRPRDAPRWAPRTMDIDVLLYDGLILDEPKLKLPRPDLLKRPYMLGPLAELAPQVVHPVLGLAIGELWQRFDRASHPMERLPATTATSQCSGRHPRPESAP
ncbi:MAG TPA: 2-amino-4-hydroxy-6-hydroxymethyldihydropteridine diphosphokinase [Steroidobacteraceae bacterium]|nr:2-amino-4-hydroxy-6-hydroxymethyldihydropteridine diphosphokinase [Steroidobacteraceae bacterium]